MTAAAAPIDPARLVFVAGLHRSGTTPLTRILGTHPDISTFSGTGVKEDEGQHLQSVYPAARQYGGAGRFANDPRSHLTDQSPLCTPDNAARLLGEWRRYWDLSRPVLVEKSPPNLVMTRYLTGLFPRAKIVVCIRHPIVVALSTAKWAGPFSRLDELVAHWGRAYATFRADAEHLESFHVVRYERLVAEPDADLAELAGYLGLSSPISSAGVDSTRSAEYVEAWSRQRNSRLPWVRHTVNKLAQRHGAMIEDFGYDLNDLTAVMDAPLMSRPGGGDE